MNVIQKQEVLTNLAYNYVFFDEKGNFFRIVRYDLKDCKECLVRENGLLPSNNDVVNFLFRLHTSRIIDKYAIKIPFQRIWNKPFVGKLNFDSEKPICFLFCPSLSRYYDMDLFRFLRKKYPNCVIALLLRDVVEVCLKSVPNFDINLLINSFDHIFTINKYDAIKYRFHLINPVCSYYPIHVNQDEKKYDLIFIGKAKERAHMINRIYRNMSQAGVRCEFIIFNRDPLIKFEKGIKVIDKYLPYESVLEKTVAAKTILEITQDNISAVSARCLEALCYNIKLVTDVEDVKKLPFYNSEFIQVFNNPEEINPDFIKSDSKVDYKYDGSFSPIYMLQNIDYVISNR